jgi:phage-related minor tail protein
VNDLIDEAKGVLVFLVGAVTSLLTWIGARQIKRIDALEEQSVTRDELAKTLTQMREDRLQMHRENREELRYIRERVDGIADRE